MRMHPRFLGVAILCGFLALAFGRAQEQGAAGKKIGDITLQGVDGKTLALHDLKGNKALVVVFLSFDCPVSTGYLPALNALAQKYKDEKVRLIGICPTSDTVKSLTAQAEEYRLGFPIYRDTDMKAAQQFGAQTMPEAFVLDGTFTVRYQGRIDDSYYARLKKKNQVPRQDLALALGEVLSGKAVSVAETKAIGCPIVYPKTEVPAAKVTYYRDVLPILQKSCQGCHRPGEVGPFSLLSYEQAARWADDIKVYTQNRQMPPWIVAEGVPFRNERKLTDKEIATLAAWADAGAPAGNPKDAPPPRQFTDGWVLGEPDVVLEPDGTMTVAATGGDLFRCFVLPTNQTEDKFVAAYEIRPGNRKVVHHALNFLDTSKRGQKLQQKAQAKADKNAKDFGPGYTSMMGPGFFPPDGDVGGWAPGLSAQVFPPGVGYYLPRGSDIVMQIHYHRNGKVEKDRTRLGLYFTKGPAKAIQPLIIPGWITWIPAGAAKHQVKGSVWLAEDCTIYNVTPHMHLLGKSIKVTMTPPKGDPLTLVRIDAWDYNWQETYFFKEPIRVKAGTKFAVEAVYDNSSNNPLNPFSPPRTIFPGEQTTNEMCFGFIDCTTDNDQRLHVQLSPGGISIPHIGVLPKMPK